MKKFISIFFTFLCLNLPANARTVYVSDVVKFSLRSEANRTSKILKMMPSGTPLTVLEENKETGYLKVLYGGNIEGFIMTRFTLNKPVSLWQLKKTTTKLKKLQKKYAAINTKFNQLKHVKTDTISSNKSLLKERDRLSTDLNALKITAANAIQLKHQKDQLEERVIFAEREFEKVKREKQTLEYSTDQNWFLYGGILSLFGVILGFILPKLSWRTRASNWDFY